MFGTESGLNKKKYNYIYIYKLCVLGYQVAPKRVCLYQLRYLMAKVINTFFNICFSLHMGLCALALRAVVKVVVKGWLRGCV